MLTGICLLARRKNAPPVMTVKEKKTSLPPGYKVPGGDAPLSLVRVVYFDLHPVLLLLALEFPLQFRQFHPLHRFLVSGVEKGIPIDDL